MRYILHPGEPGAPDRLGGKAAALASLRWCGPHIPAWFVLTPEAFDASLGESQHRFLTAEPTPGRLAGLTLGPEPRRELAEALSRLCPNGEPVAVRSSAAEEDGDQRSFAGQFESFLFVHPSEVPQMAAAVWRSAFSESVLAYRRRQGLPSCGRPPAVLVQRMVNADRSGVAFSADPVTGQRGVAVVVASYGLGTSLVSGEQEGDAYRVDREGRILSRVIAEKRTMHRAAPGAETGLRDVDVHAEDAARPALTDAEVSAVAALVRRTAHHIGCPQDIEWAIEDGCLYLLQARPITTISRVGDPDGALCLWDNSNISESYAGVTTPLTFSFARRAYEEVYRQFCRVMRVPAAKIAAHDDMFRRMLGLIRGRVYYNLVSWYRVLALLPGFTFNRRFMEQMMGVRERLPEGLLPAQGDALLRDRLQDGANLLVTLAGLLANHCRLPRRIASFRRQFDIALGPVHPALEDRRPDELAAYYHQLERQLLTRWDAPLINDFFTMIFFGVLRSLTERWCGDREGNLCNDLLCGEMGMISTEPARRMREMAEIAAASPALVASLCDGSLEAIREEIERARAFADRYRNYLERFGERCLEELKLESLTLYDDPLPLLRAVGHLASRLGSPDQVSPPAADAAPRIGAERRVRAMLKGHRVRRLLFRWVLGQARARVRDRENLRFERTRLFGRVRRIFCEFGRRFSALSLVDDPRDIFYLEVEEILGLVEGTGTCANLKGLIALRKVEFAGYRDAAPLPDRFETHGLASEGPIQRKSPQAPSHAGESRTGTGCCPGIVRGPVRVIVDPRRATLRQGDILVAERTDPGWIVLFPAAAGLIVERGSLLSHSAIIARELRIPAVVSLAEATRWLHDGDWVELDGGSGVVRRLPSSGKGEANAL
jgi:phosphohistidine swiveling domain-containing protein